MEGFASGGDVNKLRCGAGEGGIQMQCRAARWLARNQGNSGDWSVEKPSKGMLGATTISIEKLLQDILA